MDGFNGIYADVPGHNDFAHTDIHFDNGVRRLDGIGIGHADGIPGHNDSSPHTDGGGAPIHGDGVHVDNGFPGPGHHDLP